MVDIGRVGIWSIPLRYGDAAEAADAAAELDELGFGALWIPGGAGGDIFGSAGSLLGATQRAVVATGILNLWMHPPEETAAGHAALTAAHPGRFLLGIGVSHAALIDGESPGRYQHPLQATAAYLDALDAASPPVPADERVLAALGPRMLGLAGERAAGVHPYLVPTEHSRVAREALGQGPLVAPEQAVVLETDPTTAREIARAHVGRMAAVPNYGNNLLRLGFEPDDLTDGGSDRLVDALVAWGDVDAVAARVQEHLDAGADHVALQVLTAEPTQLARAEWRRLAEGLLT